MRNSRKKWNSIGWKNLLTRIGFSIVLLSGVAALFWIGTPRAYRSERLLLAITVPSFWRVKEFERVPALTISPRFPRSQVDSVYVMIRNPVDSEIDLIDQAMTELSLVLRAEQEEVWQDSPKQQIRTGERVFSSVQLGISSDTLPHEDERKILGQLESVQPVTLLMWKNGRPYPNQYAYIFLGADDELNQKAMRMMDSIEPLGTGE